MNKNTSAHFASCPGLCTSNTNRHIQIQNIMWSALPSFSKLSFWCACGRREQHITLLVQNTWYCISFWGEHSFLPFPDSPCNVIKDGQVRMGQKEGLIRVSFISEFNLYLTVPSSSSLISPVHRAFVCKWTVLVAGILSLAIVGVRPGARNWLAKAFSVGED